MKNTKRIAPTALVDTFGNRFLQWGQNFGKYLCLWLIISCAALFITGCDLGEYASENVIIATSQNNKLDYLICINAGNAYSFDGNYAKQLDKSLVSFTQTLYGSVGQVERATYQAFCQLQIALAEKGIAVGILSGYRTYEDQEYMYELRPAEQAAPGYCEHHTGLNISMMVWSDSSEGESGWALEGVRIPENETITALLPEFGFIRRYPAGKEEVTGMIAKPYEIRYVGREAARKIAKEGITLEEYLKK